MFKGLNKLGRGLSKGFNQAKRHVKNGHSPDYNKEPDPRKWKDKYPECVYNAQGWGY